MFGNSKPSKEAARAFEAAKQATRRAAFLTRASQLPASNPDKQDLALLFRVCRAAALANGAAVGQSAEEVDAAISALCDADIAKLKKSSDRAVQDFARESHKVTKAFLATVDPVALAATTRPPN
jgi:hypothetical protein